MRPAVRPSEDTWANDTSLPKLPVPTVAASLKRLRDSCAAAGATPDELNEFDQLVPETLSSLEEAQALLKERQSTLVNYIGPWWDEFAYLRCRDPLVHASNVFCVRDSDFAPNGAPRPPARNRFNRAAMLCCESLIFRNVLLTGMLAPERQGKVPLCMHQYRRYYCCRIPRKECDELKVMKPEDTKFIHVMYRGAHFVIKAVQEDGSVLNCNELLACIKLGVASVTIPAADECVAVLTGTHRDAWATAWAELCSASLNNAQNLDLITSCIISLGIDNSPITSLKSGINRACHGAAHNRWYDRTSMRVVAGNGVVVENGEHSPMDAIVSASTPMDLMILKGKKAVDSGEFDDPPRANFNPSAYVKVLTWQLTPSIKAAIRLAAKQHADAVRVADIDTFTFPHFGRNVLREMKVNADGFVQQAIQLAFSRDRGRVVPVYETGSTRMFQQGRTDTIRSLTLEQRALVAAMGPKVLFPSPPQVAPGAAHPAQPIYPLLVKALQRHQEISVEAITGRGFDRHLMCLKIAQGMALKKPLPKLLTLPCVVNSGKYSIFTSQMIGRMFVGGFAHVLPDGYGCCYYLRPNAIVMIVSGCTSGGLTNVDRFKKQLAAAMIDLMEVAKCGIKPDEVELAEAKAAADKKLGTAPPAAGAKVQRLSKL